MIYVYDVGLAILLVHHIFIDVSVIYKLLFPYKLLRYYACNNHVNKFSAKIADYFQMNSTKAK